MTQHTVYTLCLDCGKWGCNLPGVTDCGNCGSRATLEYRSKEDILHLVYRAFELGRRGGDDAALLKWAQEMEQEGEL